MISWLCVLCILFCVGAALVRTVVGGRFGTINGTDTPARLNVPLCLARATNGMLFVIDAGNQVIRSIDTTSQTMSTLVGSEGVGGYVDGVGSNAQFRFPSTGGKDTYLSGIVVDAIVSRLFVSDGYNAAIRMVDIATRSVSTLAGQPPDFAAILKGVKSTDGVGTSAKFTYPPSGIALLSTPAVPESVFTTDAGCIRQIVVVSRLVTTVVGQCNTFVQPYYLAQDGLGTSINLNSPTALSLDTSNMRLYFVDSVFVRLFDLTTRQVSTVAGKSASSSLAPVDGVGTSAVFAAISGISVFGSELLILSAGVTINVFFFSTFFPAGSLSLSLSLFVL